MKRVVAALALLPACVTKTVVVRETVYVPAPAGGPPLAPLDPARPHAEPPLAVPPAEQTPMLPVVAEAVRHVGATAVRVRGQSFRYDCSGFVRGMFATLGLDVMSLGNEFPGANGVRLIYEYMGRNGVNHRRARPDPGDVIYWDDTVDKNKDGRVNDPLTHIGIVVSVDDDGTVHFVHRNNSGIVREVMNLRRPSDERDEGGKRLNDWLRAKKRREPPGVKHLAGELFAGFGTLTRFQEPVAMLASPRWAFWPAEP